VKHAEALEIANRVKPARPTELVSNAGGRARYATFRVDGEDVVARLFKTDIVRWHNDGIVTLNSGGYRTATTKEAMCALIGQCSVFSEKRVWKVIDLHKGRVDFHDGIRVVIDRPINWEKVIGSPSGNYLQGEYRGMHCELFHNDHLGHLSMVWDWSFYDPNSDDPDLAVAMGDEPTKEAAERALIEYIDGMV
jgi:hypothetical protein